MMAAADFFTVEIWTAFGLARFLVFDVCTSQAAFDKFGKTLMPILQQLGIDTGQPSVMPVHKVIVPTAKATVAAASPFLRPPWPKLAESAV
jgi:hypothetical protein